MLFDRLIMTLLLMSGISFCQANELPVDLNGFRLWQYRSAAENYFGKPFQKIQQGDSAIEAHQVSKDSYMVFEYWKKFPENAISIQITGYPSKMTLFKGLALGDSESKVTSVLGNPVDRKQISDPPVTVFHYDKANYTTEIDQQGRLYSIKINLTKEMMNDADTKSEYWVAFKRAVLNKDIDAIFQWLRPDVEISRLGKSMSMDKRYIDFKSAPNKEFIEALIGEKNSVRSQLQVAEPEVEMRLMLEMGVGFVHKFYKDKVLAEIVFFPYNGQYRVYEVNFRDEDELKKPALK